jgi:hypothetical protein
MHHHTELTIVDEFRWVSPKKKKKKDDRTLLFLVRIASGAAIFTLLLHRHVAFLHRTATTCQPLFKP